ncbi:MAG TPA: DUF1345 domain-containing protein [Xanthobacteraceae bacterium]|jgi:uncharacterized membrane protein|nr:DUF1345 domain-containing protein [Xanthobacteraceae bacterium]
MTVPEKRRNPLQRWIRIVRARPRLFLAILLGLAVGVFLPAEWRPATRLLVAWDIALGLYLVLAFRLMTNCDVNRIKRRAAHQDEGRITILVLVVASAMASLLAILAELGGANRQPAHLALAAVTILLSWAFTHTIFAIHYAHEYYDENAHKGGGLNFPGDQPPDYWDFVYFSFVVGMTSQVSDVAVTSSTFRRLVAAHGVVSFIFNATLLALTVNIAAGAI